MDTNHSAGCWWRERFQKRAARLVLWGALLGSLTTPEASLFGQSDTDITFFVGSDLHYGNTNATQNSADISRGALDRMNALPGQPLPASVGGGVVDTPRGVLLLGDLTHFGTPAQWTAFTNDWGLNGEGRLRFPVYEGLGNHDGFSNFMLSVLRARNPSRTGVSHISTNGYHYSWDWGALHLVQLNFCAANEPDTVHLDPQHSLDFLIDDLATRVGSSGRPVLLCQHYGFDSVSTNLWWSELQRSNLFQAIQSYNVIAILCGHTHDINVHPWHNLMTYTDGSLGYWAGNFFVVHMTATNLTLIERRADNTWGTQYTQPITTSGAPVLWQNPQSATLAPDASVTLSASAWGPNLAYQWFFDNQQVLSGATNRSLTLTHFGATQAGAYSVVVTNNAGAVTSPPAVLSLPMVGTAMRIDLAGDVGSTWEIEYVDDLSPWTTNWLPLVTLTLTNTAQAYYDRTGLTQAHRFYRVVPVP